MSGSVRYHEGKPVTEMALDRSPGGRGERCPPITRWVHGRPINTYHLYNFLASSSTDGNNNCCCYLFDRV